MAVCWVRWGYCVSAAADSPLSKHWEKAKETHLEGLITKPYERPWENPISDVEVCMPPLMPWPDNGSLSLVDKANEHIANVLVTCVASCPTVNIKLSWCV